MQSIVLDIKNFSPEFQREVKHLELVEKRKEEAMRYIKYFEEVLSEVEKSSLLEQIRIYDLFEYIDKNELWDPSKWEELHPKWRWKLEEQIWEWYLELVPEKKRDVQQQRIIISK